MQKVVFAFLGTLAGFTPPLGWLLWRAFSSRHQWWLAWLQTEFDRHYEVYAVLTTASVVFLGVLGFLIGKHNDDLLNDSKNVRDENSTLNELATTDGLTGLFNTRHIHEQLMIELENAYQTPLTCLLIDIDYFKRINDNYGHPFGDQVLVKVAQVLLRATRRVDPVGRLGGEEFVVLLPNTPGDKATVVAERIRKSVEEASFIYEGEPVKITVSIGMASTTATDASDPQRLLKAVDEALYKAKRAGRNRLVVWEQAA